MDAGMRIVLTSGANRPMGLRSSVAMAHIGILLGMDRVYADKAVNEFPKAIIERNLTKIQPNFVSDGVEIIQRENEK
jgi:RNase P/RNase MRP subunit p30